MYILYSQVWTQHGSTSPGCLCAYNARLGSLLRIRPRSGEAEAFQLTLASHGAVKLQPWHSQLLIYAEGGQELVVAMEGAAARLEVQLQLAWKVVKYYWNT